MSAQPFPYLGQWCYSTPCLFMCLLITLLLIIWFIHISISTLYWKDSYMYGIISSWFHLFKCFRKCVSFYQRYSASIEKRYIFFLWKHVLSACSYQMKNKMKDKVNFLVQEWKNSIRSKIKVAGAYLHDQYMCKFGGILSSC